MSQEPGRGAPEPAALGERGFFARTAVQLALVLLVGCIAYANTFTVPFVFDDMDSIVGNDVIHDLGRFLSGEGYRYNPRRFVGYLSLALNYHVGGLDVRGYHLVNLGIHLACALLVYALARLALRAQGVQGSGIRDQKGHLPVPGPMSLVPLFAALLFVAHPIQTQAVTYVVQRLSSLATLFYLCGAVCYLRTRLAQEEAGRYVTPGALAWGALTLAGTVLAMKTKEIGFTLPIMLLVLEFSFFSGSSRKGRLLLLVPLLLCLVIVPLSMMGSGRTWGELLYDLNEATRVQTTIPRSAYLITQFSVIATYLRLMLLPWGQNLDHDYPVYTSLLHPRPLWGLLLICGLLALALWAGRKAGTRDQGSGISSLQDSLQSPEPRAQSLRLISFGILWFFIALSVESSFIPIVDVIYEHRMYLPSVGLFLLAGVAAQQAAQRLSRRTFLLLGVLVVGLLTLLTHSRNRVWQSQTAIWGDAVSKSPAKGRPHANLGKALHDAGRTQEALPHLRLGVQLDPSNPTALFNLGVLLDDMGHPALAIPAYQQALALQPDFPDALGNLANDLIMTGRTEEAISRLETALALAPRNAALHNSMGVALLQTGSIERAITHLEEAVSLSPAYAKGHLNLGRAYGAVGRHEEAAQHLRTAATLAPEQGKPAP